MSKLVYASPFFIVRHLKAAVSHYTSVLGFACDFAVPDDDPFFAVVSRDQVRFALKEIGPDVPPLPNVERHRGARWDVFVSTTDPDELYREYVARGAHVHVPLGDNLDDGLRSFELRDLDGYVLAFGRPLTSSTSR
jgi:catechol 2,3-dioxygenase-like lactoylglutathione lyase family enzyme